MSSNCRRPAFKVGVISVLILLAIWRGGAAQVIKPNFKDLSLGDLGKTDTFKKLKDGLKKIKDIKDLGDKYYKDLEKLSPDDEQYEPDYTPPGAPELPSLCKNSEKCAA